MFLNNEAVSRLQAIDRFNNRELSWLEFNDRVLEEANDAIVPLLERIKFLAIYASNLDEFFMVRVATVRRQIEAGVTKAGPDGLSPAELMQRITQKVSQAHENIGKCLREQLLPALEHAGIFLVDDKTASSQQVAYASKYFHKTVRPLMTPLAIDSRHPFPQLENKALYFCVELAHRKKEKAKIKLRLVLVQIPSLALGRFVTLPEENGRKHVIRLDDVIRLNLQEIFPGDAVLGCYAIKVVRDAELEFIEDEAHDLLATISDSLEQRKWAPATRFLYDPEMPARVLEMFVERLGLDSANIFPGARYHSFSDFMQFPSFDLPELQNPAMPPLTIATLERSPDVFSAIRQGDVLLHHPYQSFDYVVRLLEAAAEDPETVAIKVTLYRIAQKSLVAKALGRAAKQGKQVTAVVELKARFDEESNISWARKLEKDGVHVIYGMPDLKVHCKLTMVVRKEADSVRRYCHLSTGNYNDRTARVYADLGIMTARDEITEEVASVFDMLTGYSERESYRHLLVAPTHMRPGFIQRIRREAENATAGRKSGIIAKLNSLVDPEIIDEIYLAGLAGVRIQLIVRGICCLKPGVPGLSENLTAVSIIDRFLEHGRIYWFENDGKPECFLASADWMPRNLDRRVEVAFPVLDETIQQQIREIVDLQLADNVKARLLNADSSNVRRKCEGKAVRSQVELYELAKRYAG